MLRISLLGIGSYFRSSNIRRGQPGAAAADLFGCFVYNVLNEDDCKGSESGDCCDYQ